MIKNIFIIFFVFYIISTLYYCINNDISNKCIKYKKENIFYYNEALNIMQQKEIYICIEYKK